MPDPRAILDAVLDKHDDHKKWSLSRFEKIKRISNQKVGQVGQDFVEALCDEIGFAVEFPLNTSGKRTTQSPWDIKIEGITFEQKTATEDINGAFQFNHIRYHRAYDAVLCIGIAPEDINFGVWSKAEIVTGMAGNLVSMERGGSVSYKLTKRPHELYFIHEFEDEILTFLARQGDHHA